MKRFSILCVLVSLITFSTQTTKVAHAQQTGESPHENLNFPELNDFQRPEVETYTTDNGITFYLVEDTELPLINVNARIRTGGVLVPNEKAGLASITGTVMRSGGTETYPADSLNALLENRAASIETGISFTNGTASMNVLKEDFENLIPVFVDVLTNPAFPDEKIELAKTQTKSSISRRNDNIQQIGTREFQRLIYGPDTRYGRNTEYETVNNISREDLVNFHDEHFTAENMMVGVVGDFDSEEMKEKLEETFGQLPAGDETTLEFPEVDYEPQSSINFINKPDVNQSFVMLGHIGGLRDNPDYAKVQVMNQVLSGGFSGRLLQIVRSEMGLAYSVYGRYGMNSFYPGVFYAGVQTKSSTTAEAIDAIIEQIERLQNEPITEKELQDTKDQILNSAVFEYDSYEEVLSQQMSYAYRGLPSNAFEQYIEDVKETTIEDVQSVAQEYLDPGNLQILVVGNKDEIGDQLEKYGKVNEIDISIPEPGSGEQEVVKGDAEKGQQLLNQMADAVISPDTELNTLTVSGQVQQQGQTMQTTMTVDYPDAIEQTIQAPMGKVQLSYKGGSGTMTAGGQERSLPPQMANSLKSTLNKSFVSIALNAGEVNPQFLGTEEVGGTTYNKLNVTVDDSNVAILLNQETNYPDIIRYKQFNPQMGSEVTVENRHSDWNTVDGVAYPYTQVTIINGNESGKATYESHEVNK
ncbi:insulinase family protein [Aliifodinibius salicampi]|uniref:Insulinase family protein n=1 Tax=Fodinibius salicampi TaxID=1920655 RepID=A0ABT3Q1F8_9BACT|nr:pitrilysin family protein [Fodinibius salicampi]MCW9713937.1 insulinase family protein [Fodinibius salicampi]